MPMTAQQIIDEIALAAAGLPEPARTETIVAAVQTYGLLVQEERPGLPEAAILRSAMVLTLAVIRRLDEMHPAGSGAAGH